MSPGLPAPPSDVSGRGLVSVIIATHNFGPFIEEAVASVLAGGVSTLELIVVDDGSTDDTLQRLARIVDPRLLVTRVDKGGVGAARNHGLRLARGEYIAFLDADDRWRPGKLHRQLAVLESEPDVGFVFTNFVRFDEGGFHDQTQFDLVPEFRAVPTRGSRAGAGRVIEGDTFCRLAPLSQLPCWTQTMVVRAALVRGIAFPADMRLSEDLRYVLDVYRVGRGAFIEEPLVEVRRHAGNSYRRADEKLLPDIDALTRAARAVTDPHHRAVLQRRLGRAWLGAGYYHFWRGSIPFAAYAYARAALHPGVRGRALLRLAATPLAAILRAHSPARGELARGAPARP